MLKLALLDCAINEKCCRVEGGRGICPVFSSPPRGIWQLKSPHPHEEPHKVPAQFPVIILPPISCMLAGVRLAVIDSDLHRGVSLRSKRFQSSYSAKFGAGAKKNGRGRNRLVWFLHSPPLPPSFLFLLSFQFSRRTRAEPLATQPTQANRFISWLHTLSRFFYK